MIDNIIIFIISVIATFIRATLLFVLLSCFEKKSMDLRNLGRHYYKVIILVAFYYLSFYGFVQDPTMMTILCIGFFLYYYYLMSLFSQSFKSGVLTYALISILTYSVVKINVQVMLFYDFIEIKALIPVISDLAYSLQYGILIYVLMRMKKYDIKKYFYKLMNRFSYVLYIYLFVEALLTLLGNIGNHGQALSIVGNSYVLIPFAVLVLVIIVIYQMKYFIVLTCHLEDQVLMQKYYVSSMEELYDDIRQYKHDVNNMLLPICMHIQDENYEGLIKYYKEFFENYKVLDVDMYHILAHLINLHIAEIKGLILSKYQWAKQSDIDFNVVICEPIDYIEMNIVDVCRVLGIVLDNAIEAAKCVEHGYVVLSMSKLNSKVEIEVTNNYDFRSLSITGNTMLSCKGQDRGIGLNSLKAVMNRYVGNKVETNITREEFKQKIVLD